MEAVGKARAVKKKTKIILGFAVFIAGGTALTALFARAPGHEMAKLADDFCECGTEACRNEVLTKIYELEDEYTGKSARQEVVNQWNAAQARILQCAAKPLE